MPVVLISVTAIRHKTACITHIESSKYLQGILIKELPSEKRSVESKKICGTCMYTAVASLLIRLHRMSEFIDHSRIVSCREADRDTRLITCDHGCSMSHAAGSKYILLKIFVKSHARCDLYDHGKKMVVGIAVLHHGTGLKEQLGTAQSLYEFFVRDTILEEILLGLPVFTFKTPEGIRIVQIVRNTRLHMKEVIYGNVCSCLIFGEELIESIVKAELSLLYKL